VVILQSLQLCLCSLELGIGPTIREFVDCHLIAFNFHMQLYIQVLGDIGVTSLFSTLFLKNFYNSSIFFLGIENSENIALREIFYCCSVPDVPTSNIIGHTV
jgi:hypothetical protein